MKLIRNVKLISPEGIIGGKALLFTDKIEKIIDEDELANFASEDMEIIDGQGNYLSPGFIDIHIHGAAGYDTMDATYEALNGISRAIAASGVTSFLATTMTMPEKKIREALDNARQTMQQGTGGARLLGIHAEGPFLNPGYKGAQAAKDIILPSRELLADYLDLIKLVTLAPERPGAEDLIKYLHSQGIVVSVGHSAASYEEVIQAKQWGLAHATHLFNAMTGLHHRKPGIVGAALTTDLSCELIADFIHLHPAVIKLVLRAKPLAELVLVTDQMEAGSLAEGEYSLGGQKVIVKDGAARLENGQLAGSVLTLDQAVRNLLSLNLLSLPQVISLVTINPARVLGLDDTYGLLEEGYQADLVLLNGNIEVERVFVGGREIN